MAGAPPVMSPARPAWTQADVTSLCTAGSEAWAKLGPGVSQAPFTWRGGRYVATRARSRMIVKTASGALVACRWD